MVEPGLSFRYDVALITLGLLAYALASGVSAQVNPPAKKPQTKAFKPTSKPPRHWLSRRQCLRISSEFGVRSSDFGFQIFKNQNQNTKIPLRIYIHWLGQQGQWIIYI